MTTEENISSLAADRRALALAAIAALGVASGDAAGRETSLKEQLVGAWAIAGCEVVNADGTPGRPLVVGRNPLGQFIFTGEGRFSFQMAAEIANFASGDYRKTTPQENRAVVEGSMAYFGTWSATDADKTIHLHIERSSIPNLNGTDGKRVVLAISAGEMRWTNPAPLGGGSISCENRRVR